MNDLVTRDFFNIISLDVNENEVLFSKDFLYRSKDYLRRKKIYRYLFRRLLRNSSNILLKKQKRVLELILGYYKGKYIGIKKDIDIINILGIKEESFYLQLRIIKKRLKKYFNKCESKFKKK